MKILIADDLETRFPEVEHALRASGHPGLEIIPLVANDLKVALTSLFEMATNFLDSELDFKATSGLAFDHADIVVLDNNLAHLNVKGVRLTAESIAGYIRAFTSASYIVSINKNPDVDFDLRYLVGDYSTRADIALNTSHLANRALWTGRPSDATQEFLPWYWPKLATMPKRRQAQIAYIETHLDDPVVQALGFPAEAIGFLSLHARGALCPQAESNGRGGDGKPFAEVTFRDVFIARDRSLPATDERETVSNAEKRGSPDVRRIIARVVAADVDLWFRRDVLGPQEALVDIPHLAMRLPFLLGRAANDLTAWNDSASTDSAPFGLDGQLYTDHIAKTKFGHDIWVRSPSFWWPQLKENEKLNDLIFGSTSGAWRDAVFCEDCSLFRDRALKQEVSPPIEFSAEFEGSWGRRHVAQLPGIRYAPRSRFALL